MCARVRSQQSDAACDLDALTHALDHGRRGTMLDPRSAEGWSTLGFALSLNGDSKAAIREALKAVKLERDIWRHSLRLGFVGWGDDRLEAANTALALFPGLALAHWLKGTVLIIAQRLVQWAISSRG